MVERRLALAGLGMIQALRNSAISLEEAENDLFNLDTYRLAKRRKFDPKLIEFLEWGMELSDVSQLAPNGVEESYHTMERLLSRTIASARRKKTTAPRRRAAKKKA